MLPISKLTAGVRVARLMMRVTSKWGEGFDALGGLSDSPLEISVFTNPSSASFSDQYRAEFPTDRLQLLIGVSDIVLQTTGSASVKPEKFMERFEQLWTTINRHLQVTDIRRLGLVAEYRRNQQESSAHLVRNLTRMPTEGFPAKFLLNFERRLPTITGARPDPKSSDFVNLIYQIYDSVRDETPEEGAFNANLDVQRYYDPLLQEGVPEQLRALYRKHFEDHWRKFQKTLEDLSVLGAV